MSFFTAINCMDGRVQLPVIKYLQERYKVEFVDVITEPGPNRILAENSDNDKLRSIFERVAISIEKHKSKGIAIIGHHDCAGNPASEAEQKEHLDQAVEILRQQYGNTEIIGLWVDSNWEVHQVD
jgi:hypothetical protein